MTVETKARFARRIGKSKSYVTRAGQQGRLVLTSDNLVDVEGSLELLDATRGRRYDVDDRWRAYRAGSTPDDGQNLQPTTSAGHHETHPDVQSGNNDVLLQSEEIGRRTRLAQMRKEESVALRHQLELQQIQQVLVNREQIESAMADAVAVILGVLETLPDRLTPQVQAITDFDQIYARIREETEHLCQRASDELLRVAKKASVH